MYALFHLYPHYKLLQSIARPSVGEWVCSSLASGMTVRNPYPVWCNHDRTYMSNWCHDLISPFYYISFSPLFSILISSFQPFSQLWNCSYSIVGSVSQAIFVLLLFLSPFSWYLMGIFLKYWAISCNSLAHLSLVIDTLVPLGTPEFTPPWSCYLPWSPWVSSQPLSAIWLSPGELPLF